MKPGLLFGLSAAGGLALAVIAKRRQKPAPASSPGDAVIVPPPPDAVWLKDDASGAQSNGSDFAVYLTGTSQLLELNAGRFLDSRFTPLPVERRPTRTQLATIVSTFTTLGVDRQTGIIRSRPSYEATNAALDLATSWDAQGVPSEVGKAIRDFARMAWEQLPIAAGSKTA